MEIFKELLATNPQATSFFRQIVFKFLSFQIVRSSTSPFYLLAHTVHFNLLTSLIKYEISRRISVY